MGAPCGMPAGFDLTSPSTTTTVYLARSSLRRNCIWLNIVSILQLQAPWVRTGSSSRPFQQTVVVVLGEDERAGHGKSRDRYPALR